jgi:ribosomal-protein-alanine N-acetyltransferase
MEITTANLLDLNELRHVEKICFPKDAWPILDLIAVLTFPGVIRLKAVEKGAMAGFIAGDPRPAEGLAWVATLGVLPEYRRHGIGKALLEACEAQVSQQKMRLSVRMSNEEAIRMYQKCGYYTVDHWLNYYNDGEDALIMEKSIRI